ncbi:amidase [Sporothrix schenckii 1099-18]|uniref:CN hydrolase domain-containing protein n=1 Tax=Sporothrix schenckii 1099-18 TaxID=1397361 RepID=A0A0F2M250_SPOSC|nr:amidase [Sporothrix schenckii 1099-18]KJR83788.1 hypothetical protein SPSK_03920 [Sporothrix schenckii 1099-18]
MRIGCLQFSPQVGDVDNNLNRADAVLNKAHDVDGLDLLVLPELAFSGYNFRSLAEISPYLEPSGSGISALWARTTALKWNCNVVVGYPEKVDVAQKWPTSPEFYNSAIIVNQDGETIANYRKSFLYAVDETWALEGQDGFFDGYVEGLGDVAMGICMDLKFEAPWNAFEFAYHILEVQANLVILTMSWLTRESAHTFSQLPQEPDFPTLEYWVQRLEPIIRKESEEEIIVVLCNRSGTERDAVYAGTSTVLGIKNGEVNLYGVLGRGVKELLVVDTEKAPFAKLLRTNHGRKSEADTAKDRDRDSNESIAGSTSTESRKPTPFPLKRAFHPFREFGRSGEYDDDYTPTPIEDIDDAWEITSTAASHGSAPSSYSQSGPQPSRNLAPKLELHIPNGHEFPLPLRKAKGPGSATTRDQEGKSPSAVENDIPTPTAPSPTPMSMRPTFNLPDKKPPVPGKKDVIPSSVNRRGGGGAVKVSRADTPITPPLRVGAKGKGRGPTPISEAPPSPPSEKESARTGSSNFKGSTSSNKKGQAPGSNRGKSSSDKREYGSVIHAKAESIARQSDRTKLSVSASVGPGPATSARQFMTNDELWEQALRNLKRSDSDIIGDSGYDPDRLEDILVGDPSSQLEMQTQMTNEIRQKFEHLNKNNERQPSPVQADLPNRPPSTKSRNASLPRVPQAFNGPSDLRRLSVSRMSIPILASPSLFRQDSQAQSHLRGSDSPIYFRPESQGVHEAAQPQRTGSAAANPDPKRDNSKSSQNSTGSGASLEKGSRPVSRGRQPFSKINATNGTSIPSTQRPNTNTSRVSNSLDRGRRTSNNRSGESVSRSDAPSALSSHDRVMSTNSASNWLFSTPPLNNTQPPLDPDDEIIAMISLIDHHCPVHNSNSRAPSQEPQAQLQATQQARAQSRGQGQGQGRAASQPGERPPRQREATPHTQTPNQQQPEQILSRQQSQAPAAQEGNAEPVYEVILPPHIRELVESLSSPDSSVQSPLRALEALKTSRSTPKFDPPTPTAMQFDTKEEKKLPASA